VVVEIESNNPHGDPAPFLGQERNVEAHCHVVRIPCGTQPGKIDVGLCTLQEVPRCENANENTNLGSPRRGKKVEEREVDQTGVSEVSGPGNPGMENDPLLMERVDGCLGMEEFDEVIRGITYGIPKPIVLGEEGASAGSRLMLSPRRHKFKGLSELGDFSSNLRRSVRINAHIAQVGVSTHHRHGTSSDSISDGDFINCNSRHCEPGNMVDPPKLWEIGK